MPKKDPRLQACQRSNHPLAATETIASERISKAIQYRSLDRQLWTSTATLYPHKERLTRIPFFDEMF
jgi:hypothetical protein